MKKFWLGLLVAGVFTAPQAASARDNTVVGVGTGAVAGAVVGGPIGAVVGGIVGGVIGSNSERARPRRARRVRAARVRRDTGSTGKIRVGQERAEPVRATGSLPSPVPAVAARATQAPAATGWQNPR